MEPSEFKEKVEALKLRSKRFAVRTIRMFRQLPRSEEARIIGKQIVRSSCSMAANYRAACRARSKAEFNAKLGVVVEEADETLFWLEMLIEADVVKESKLREMVSESRELLAIFASSHRTARSNN